MAISDHLAERPPWLVRLLHRDGDRVAGVGMLVNQEYVLTCAHVVGLQAGEDPATAGRGSRAPTTAVAVEFPFLDGTGPVMATVVHWKPLQADGDGDVAVLQLERALPGAEAAPLGMPANFSGHEFSAHGFPAGDRAARQTHGTLQGRSGPSGKWVQLEADGPTGWPVDRGFSGAPVYDHEVGAVVGIVALMDRHRTGHMLPVQYLKGLWSDMPVEDGGTRPPPPPAQLRRPPPAFQQSWTGEEPIRKYANVSEPAETLFWYVVASVFLVLAVLLQDEDPNGWFYSEGNIWVVRIGLLFVFAVIAAHGLSLYRNEYNDLRDRMGYWRLRIGHGGLSTTSTSAGDLTVYWPDIHSIVVTSIKANPLRSGSDRPVFRGVHVKFKSASSDPIKRPAGWPAPADATPGMSAEGRWYVLCVLGQMTRRERKNLHGAIARHAGEKLIDPRKVNHGILYRT